MLLLISQEKHIWNLCFPFLFPSFTLGHTVTSTCTSVCSICVGGVEMSMLWIYSSLFLRTPEVNVQALPLSFLFVSIYVSVYESIYVSIYYISIYMSSIIYLSVIIYHSSTHSSIYFMIWSIIEPEAPRDFSLLP